MFSARDLFTPYNVTSFHYNYNTIIFNFTIFKSTPLTTTNKPYQSILVSIMSHECEGLKVLRFLMKQKHAYVHRITGISIFNLGLVQLGGMLKIVAPEVVYGLVD